MIDIAIVLKEHKKTKIRFLHKLNIIDRNFELIQKNLTKVILNGKIFFVIFKKHFFSYTYNHF